MTDRSPLFRLDIITLVPALWDHLLGEGSGLVGRACAQGRVAVTIHDLRNYGLGPHHQVDDAPFGGGAGMILMVQPLHQAIQAARIHNTGPVLLLSPAGAQFSQAEAHKLSQAPGMILVCGRYGGVDERILAYVDSEVSAGDYVLSAGDPAAWMVADSVLRLRPGVLGNPASLEAESFTGPRLSAPLYTRPAEYEGQTVPEVLRSGDHEAVQRWRQTTAEARTVQRRPDLLK